MLVAAWIPVSAASEPAAAVTFGQPRLSPGEYSGDLSRVDLVQKAAPTSPRLKVYRPRLSRPASTKIGTAPLTAAPQGSATPLASPMPSPIWNFAGLSFKDPCTGGQCGAGWPPDPNGDVGPSHYVEAVNDAIAIYSKTGVLLASFTEDHLWQGQGTPCDGSSQGDPIVVYDWLADRFIMTWFAFDVDIGGNPLSPFYQCIAASKTSDPVAGGWWLYPVRTDPGGPGLPPLGDINDYSKFGLWHDCLYMGTNSFDSSGSYDGVAFASFSRSDLYSGAPLTYSLGWLPPAVNAFTLVPSNNQGTGTNAAQPGTPNYFVSESGSDFKYEVRTFTAGPNCGAGGTLSAPALVSQTAYTFLQGAIVPQPNTRNRLDMIDDRIMQKVQYRRIGGAESIWVTHPVGASGGNVAMQWAQIDVTGGTIAVSPIQEQIYAPDATLNRFMGSLAVDVQGNMALGYSTSSGVVPNFPSIAYSGRLATDPLGTLPRTEVQLIAGAGSQTNRCGSHLCDRWGDYSAMSLDPADSCTFWYVNEYYSSQTNGSAGNWQTRIGSFKFPTCNALPPTTTTLQSSLNPSNAGDTVTFTAVVDGSGPTGSVAFADGGNAISGCGGVPLSGGGNTPAALCSTSGLAIGIHNIVATYSGDLDNASSASAPLAQRVNGAGGTSLNVALASAGATASASSTFSALFPASAIIDGDRAGLNAGAGGVWRDGTPSLWPDWVEIDFSAPHAIDRVIVYSVQDDASNPVDPSDTLTFTLRGETAFDVQTWDGSTWVTQAAVTGNDLVKRTVSFTATTTSRIRVNINATVSGHYSSLTEVEAWTPGSVPPPPGAIVLGSSANPVRVGRVVTFTASVTGSDPAGSVRFTSNGIPIPGCNAVGLSGSGDAKSAACLTSFSTIGSFTIVADYSGDGINPPMTSSPLVQSVRQH